MNIRDYLQSRLDASQASPDGPTEDEVTLVRVIRVLDIFGDSDADFLRMIAGAIDAEGKRWSVDLLDITGRDAPVATAGDYVVLCNDDSPTGSDPVNNYNAGSIAILGAPKPWRPELPLPRGGTQGRGIMMRGAPLCGCGHARTVIDGKCTRCGLPIR